MKKYVKIDVFKFTKDDWHPSYLFTDQISLVNKNLVHIGLHELFGGEFRVMAWGGDDFGMDRDYKLLSEAEAMFKEVIELEFVGIKDLEKRGFKRF